MKALSFKKGRPKNKGVWIRKGKKFLASILTSLSVLAFSSAPLYAHGLFSTNEKKEELELNLRYVKERKDEEKLKLDFRYLKKIRNKTETADNTKTKEKNDKEKEGEKKSMIETENKEITTLNPRIFQHRIIMNTPCGAFAYYNAFIPIRRGSLGINISSSVQTLTWSNGKRGWWIEEKIGIGKEISKGVYLGIEGGVTFTEEKTGPSAGAFLLWTF